MKPQVLLVEDDASLGEILRTRLLRDYEIHWAKSKKEAQQALTGGRNFDLLILDVGLPDGTGFELAQSLQNPRPPILFLTAQSDAESRLQGYELGAEEYIPKPFHLKELLLRIQHVLELHHPVVTNSPQSSVLQLEGCEIDFNAMTIRLTMPNGSASEQFPAVNDMKVLQYLVQKSPKPVSRDEIMNFVWGADRNPSLRTIDNTMVRLRQMLGESAAQHLRSARGVGYQWVFAKTEGVEYE